VSPHLRSCAIDAFGIEIKDSTPEPASKAFNKSRPRHLMSLARGMSLLVQDSFSTYIFGTCFFGTAGFDTLNVNIGTVTFGTYEISVQSTSVHKMSISVQSSSVQNNVDVR